MVTATMIVDKCTRPGCGGDIIKMGAGPQCLLCSRIPGSIEEGSRMICPNKSNHVSAWPAYDRIRCPYCNRVYVLKKGNNA